jgi:hypothetical protein
VDRGTYASKLTLAGYRQATIERSGLDKGSFHISQLQRNHVMNLRQPSTDEVFGYFAIRHEACGPCPSCGKRIEHVSHKLVGRRTKRAAHNGPQGFLLRY